jgi:hypothetical protein
MIASLLALCLLTGNPAVVSSAGSFQRGFESGERLAECRNIVVWGAAGAVGGAALGPVGCLGATNIAWAVDPSLDPAKVVLEGEDADYRAGLESGYRDRLRKRRGEAAFRFGTVTTILLGIGFAAWLGSY